MPRANKLTIIIPTRNRPELARRALASIPHGPRVVVSDNSDSPDAALVADCRARKALYLRPSCVLPMREHWEWALAETRENQRTEFYTFLCDRWQFKPWAVRKLLKLARRGEVLSFNHDRLDDHSFPLKLHQARWTGRLLCVPSDDLNYLASRAEGHPALPRMLNCFAPDDLLDEMIAKYGRVFVGANPDLSFAFHTLKLRSSILYYDRAPSIHYALSLSGGASSARGDRNEAVREFGSALTRYEGTPLPDVLSVMNGLVYEYLLAGNSEVDLGAYKENLLRESELIADRLKRKQRVASVRTLDAPEMQPKRDVILPTAGDDLVTKFDDRESALRYALNSDGPKRDHVPFTTRVRSILKIRTRLRALTAR